MALFKFRLPGQGEAPDGRRRAGASTNARTSQTTPTESVESLRQRARHRVIGATVLVIGAVIGFPMLFDTEPRPVGMDVPISIPDRDNVAPLDATPPREVDHVLAQDSLNEREEVVTGDPVVTARTATPARTASAAQVQDQAQAQAQAARDQTQRDRAEQAAKDKADRDKADRERTAKAAKEREAREKAAKDKAAKEKAAKDKTDKAEKAAKDKADREKRQAQEKATREKSAERERLAKEKAEKAERADKEKAEKADKAKADTGRFVVQVGSFSDEAKVKEARSKLERAGISTYIQVVDTKEGKRTRVRVGPFGSRTDAEAAAHKIKAMGLYSGIAEL